jgi:hypothetical protein
MCIVQDIVGIAQNELQFQRLFEHHPLYRKGPHVELFLKKHF